MELGSWSIIQAPSLLALIPLVVYIVLVFRGKNNVSGIIVGIFLAVFMLGQNLKAVSVGLAASLGSSTALIGMIIMAGAGLGVLMSEAGVSRTMVLLDRQAHWCQHADQSQNRAYHLLDHHLWPSRHAWRRQCSHRPYPYSHYGVPGHYSQRRSVSVQGVRGDRSYGWSLDWRHSHH